MLDDLRQLTNRLDYRRLAGVRSVLGIELDGTQAYVAELTRRGPLWNLYAGNIISLTSFTVQLPPGGSTEERGHALRDALEKSNIRTSFAVMTIRQQALKVTTTRLPADVEHVSEWVQEHAERLLGLPIPLSEIEFQIEQIQSETPSIAVTFVRKSERDEVLLFARATGVQLLGLRPGFADMGALAALCHVEGDGADARIIHGSSTGITILAIAEGRVTSARTTPLPAPLSYDEATDRYRNFGEGNLVLSGSFLGVPSSTHSQLQPFGLSSEYAVAAALAVTGLVPPDSGSDFLPLEACTLRDDTFARSLFRRVALMVATGLLLLLAMPMAITPMLQSRTDEIEASLVVSGQAGSEIASLEKEIALLRQSNAGAGGIRSNTALSLHEIARATPAAITLQRLTLDGKDRTKALVTLRGRAEVQSAIAEFLKNLKHNAVCSAAELKKLDTRAADTDGTAQRKRGLSFEILATLNPEHVQ